MSYYRQDRVHHRPEVSALYAGKDKVARLQLRFDFHSTAVRRYDRSTTHTVA